MEWQSYAHQIREQARLQTTLDRLAEAGNLRAALGNLVPQVAPEQAPVVDEKVFAYVTTTYTARDIITRLRARNADLQPADRLTRDQVLYTWRGHDYCWTNFDIPNVEHNWEVTPCPPDTKSVSDEVHTVVYLDPENNLVDWMATTDNIIDLCNSRNYTQQQALSLMKKLVSHLATDDYDYLSTLEDPQEIVRFLRKQTLADNSTDYYKHKLMKIVRRPHVSFTHVFNSVRGLAEKIYPETSRNFTYHREKIMFKALTSFTHPSLSAELAKFIEYANATNEIVDWDEQARLVEMREKIPGCKPTSELGFSKKTSRTHTEKISLNSITLGKAKNPFKKKLTRPFSTPFSLAKEFNQFLESPFRSTLKDSLETQIVEEQDEPIVIHSDDEGDDDQPGQPPGPPNIGQGIGQAIGGGQEPGQGAGQGAVGGQGRGAIPRRGRGQGHGNQRDDRPDGDEGVKVENPARVVRGAEAPGAQGEGPGPDRRQESPLKMAQGLVRRQDHQEGAIQLRNRQALRQPDRLGIDPNRNTNIETLISELNNLKVSYENLVKQGQGTSPNRNRSKTRDKSPRQGYNSRGNSRSRGQHQNRGYSRDRQGQSRDRYRNQSRDRFQQRGRSQDRYQARGRSKDRYQNRGQSRERYQGRNPSNGRFQTRSPSRDKYQGRGRSSDKFRSRNPSRDRPYQTRGYSRDRGYGSQNPLVCGNCNSPNHVLLQCPYRNVINSMNTPYAPPPPQTIPPWQQAQPTSHGPQSLQPGQPGFQSQFSSPSHTA